MNLHDEFLHRVHGGGRLARRGAVGGLVVAAVAMMAGEVIAQQLPSITPQQLEQMQQRGGASGTSSQQSVAPSETILQPTTMPQPYLPPSRLEEIMSLRAGVKLRLVGYDQLGTGRAVNLPQVGAIQDSYVLGPGDEIVVSLRGQENSEYRVMVDRDGRVVLPRLNPVSAAGRTFGQFRQDLMDAIHRAYVSTEGFVSVGRLRQISVLVSGEVGSPGVRTLTGLSTPIDAVLVSGGIKKTGSLRGLRIIRGGREIPIDLYGAITGQARGNTTALADGDRLVVPPLGRTTAVVGWVRRPGIYELAGGQSAVSVRELLNLAGGLEVRGKYRMSVLRVASDGRNQMVPLENGAGTVGDSDILFVQPAANESSSTATLSGSTSMAGKYAANTKLSDILKAPGALGDDPYTMLGVISRRDPQTLLRTLVAFTPVAVLKGSEDLRIQNDDIVRVFSASEARTLFQSVKLFRNKVEQYQEQQIKRQVPATVFNPNNQQGQNTTNPNGTSGPNNPQNTRYGVPGNDFFGSYDAKGMPQSENARDIAILAARQVSAEGGGLSPEQLPQEDDEYYRQRRNLGVSQSDQTNPQSQQQYSAGPGNQAAGMPYGQQDQYGNYNGLNNNQENYQDFNNQYGDRDYQQAKKPLPTNIEVKRIRDFAAQLRIDSLVLINFLDDHAVNVDGAVGGPGLYLVGPDADIASLLAAAGGPSRWADKSSVEVISTNVDPSTGKSRTERRTLSMVDASAASFTVAPRDEVRLNEVFTAVGIGSVTVQGQVRHAGTYQITRGEHLSDVLMRAGGLTETAFPYGTVFLRRSVAEREQDAFRRQADEIQTQMLYAMSRRDPSAKLAPEAFSSVQNYVEQIRNQKPLGRMSVIADPVMLAANPAADPLLEPGDVVFIPQRPYSVAVLGEVVQPGSVPFDADNSAGDYIASAGGYNQFADKSETVLVLPDGSARRVEQSWFSFGGDKIPPGSTIYVARDASGTDLQQIITTTTSIFSQLAVTAASLAVLSKQ